METVESRVALRDPWFVQQVPRLVPAVSDSGSHRIGPITLDMKGAGARSAGNPPATWCAEHVQQLGSESLLSNLMEVKD
jgi:hypothetical protein